MPTTTGPFRLDGRTALVVGASRGIGAAIARAFAAAGARTILAARSHEALEEQVAAIRDAGGEAEAVVLDATETADVERVIGEQPDIDILATVAGTNRRGPFVDVTAEDIEAVRRVNVDAVLDVCQHVGRRMIKRGRGGKIILIGRCSHLRWHWHAGRCIDEGDGLLEQSLGLRGPGSDKKTGC